MKIDKENIYFNEYNESSKKMLDKYGEMRINNIYLVRQPIEKFSLMMGDLLTFYKYTNKLKKTLPRHSYILIELKMKNKSLKTLAIEKNNYIKITGDYEVKETQERIKLRLSKDVKNMTLNKILEETKDRMGKEKYFNWHIYRNNCHNITKEILKTIKLYTKKNKDFIRDTYESEMIPEFNLHLINSLQNLYNIVETLLGIRFTFWHGGRI